MRQVLQHNGNIAVRHGDHLILGMAMAFPQNRMADLTFYIFHFIILGLEAVYHKNHLPFDP